MLPLDPAAVELTRKPLEQATQLPGPAFQNQAVLEWELEHLFTREWVCAGHVDQIREQGQFFTVQVAGESVVVIADDDGLPRAFVNTCRHRGARVVNEPEGQTKRLTCPYHAWSYNLDGTLRTARFTEGLEGFDPCDYGLHPVRLAVVAGLVLLDLSGEAPPPEQHVGDLQELVARYRTADLRRGARHTYEVAANWKVIAENYNECLHCPGVHPELNKLSHYLSGEQYEGAGAWCGGSMTLTEGAETMGHGGRANIVDTREILYFALFPNALVSLHPDYVMLHTLWPRAVDRTDVVCEWFFEDGVTQIDDAVAFWDQVNREDWNVCELTQLGMGSRTYTPGRYTTQEDDVHHFDVMVADRYAAALAEIPGMSSSYDAIVVGGGHNGLTAAAYLARAGKRVAVLERRSILGGACVTEEVWPGQRVSRASYVVSMLNPKIVAELELKRFGYAAVPLDPPFATFATDGEPILFFNDDRQTYESIARVSKKDADAMAGFEAVMGRAAEFLRPLMLRPPPAIGSKHPRDIAALLREAGRAAGMGARDLRELFRVMTMSVGDLLDDHFETDALKGAYASTGVVGVWAGPRTPGTAYNLLHHDLGELDGVAGAWGHVRGGMGGISEAIAASARAAGADVRTDATVASIDVSGGAVTGVTLEDGEELHAPTVLSGAHPRRTVLDLVGGHHFPDDVTTAMQRYKTRGGSVKVNAVLSEPPRYTCGDERLLHTSLAICPSIDYLERAWQDATRGVPAAEPYIEVEVPSSIDPTLTDDGTTILTMFTQYGPWSADDWGPGDREAYGKRCFEILERYAPNLDVLHYEVLAPPDLEEIFGLEGGSIFQGEQGLDQMAFMRPCPEMAQYATPVDGLYLCGAGTHPGGGVMGVSGHNAAKRVLSDQRRTRFRRALVRA